MIASSSFKFFVIVILAMVLSEISVKNHVPIGSYVVY